jgi:hypothetical protein
MGSQRSALKFNVVWVSGEIIGDQYHMSFSGRSTMITDQPKLIGIRNCASVLFWVCLLRIRVCPAKLANYLHKDYTDDIWYVGISCMPPSS